MNYTIVVVLNYKGIFLPLPPPFPLYNHATFSLTPMPPSGREVYFTYIKSPLLPLLAKPRFSSASTQLSLFFSEFLHTTKYKSPY